MKFPWQKKESLKKELEQQFERTEWLKEIEHTRGFRLIVTMISQNESWLRDKLENCNAAELMEFQADLKAVKTWKFALSRWDSEGDKARELLFGRAEIDNNAVAVASPNSNNPN